MKIVHIVDQDFRLIEIAKEGSERMRIWNRLLNRTNADFNQLPNLTLHKIPLHSLQANVQNALQEALERNTTLPNDHPSWEGRFQEEEIFITKTFFGNTYKLCTSGRENVIHFLANIFEALNNSAVTDLYEIKGNNHKEIKEVYDENSKRLT